jgi:uncharacterized membrane protein YoaK (UPF0700 family)
MTRFFPGKQPRPVSDGWVLAAGCALAFLSAAVNALFLVRVGASVSHLTGDVSKAAVAIVGAHDGHERSGAYLLAVTLSFIAGATTSGFFIHHPELQLVRPYGRAIFAIGVCLLGAHFRIARHPIEALALSAFACGLQNALTTHYKGVILRTTHLTGLLTDLGSNLGLRLRGYPLPLPKILVPLALSLSFFAGAAAGAGLVLRNGGHPLLLLASLYIAGGVGVSLWKHWPDTPRNS